MSEEDKMDVENEELEAAEQKCEELLNSAGISWQEFEEGTWPMWIKVPDDWLNIEDGDVEGTNELKLLLDAFSLYEKLVNKVKKFN